MAKAKRKSAKKCKSAKGVRKGKLGSKVGCVLTKNNVLLCRSSKGARPKFVRQCG